MKSPWTGKRLTRLMEMADMDTLDLAYKLRVSERSVQNWLKEACGPNRVYVRKLDQMERRLEAKQAVKA